MAAPSTLSLDEINRLIMAGQFRNDASGLLSPEAVASGALAAAAADQPVAGPPAPTSGSPYATTSGGGAGTPEWLTRAAVAGGALGAAGAAAPLTRDAALWARAAGAGAVSGLANAGRSRLANAGSRLAAGGRNLRSMAGLRAGLAGTAIGYGAGAALNYAGDVVRGDREDTRGFDRVDVGQTLQGAGKAAPLAGAAGGLLVGASVLSGGAALALGAAAAGAWGIYKAITNKDDKKANENAELLDAAELYLREAAARYGNIDGNLIVEYLNYYGEGLDKYKDEESRARLLDATITAFEARMENEMIAAAEAAERREEAQRLENSRLAQRYITEKYLIPMMEQARESDLAFAERAAQASGGPSLFIDAHRANTDGLYAALLQQAMASPQIQADQQAYIRELEQQNRALRLARAGS